MSSPGGATGIPSHSTAEQGQGKQGRQPQASRNPQLLAPAQTYQPCLTLQSPVSKPLGPSVNSVSFFMGKHR